MIKFTILGNPISSKNSIRSGITKDGRNYTYVKKDVKEYRDKALFQLQAQNDGAFFAWAEIKKNGEIEHKTIEKPITIPIQASFLFYVKDNRKRDLCNLIQCPADLLQQAGIILNDCLIASLDGSRIAGIDKNNPRTEITINEVQTQ